MSADAEHFTEKSKGALRATIRRHHFSGLREDQPEPQPLTAESAT